MVVGYEEVVGGAVGVCELVGLVFNQRNTQAKAALGVFCVGGVGSNIVGDGGGETNGAEVGLTSEAHGVALV